MSDLPISRLSNSGRMLRFSDLNLPVDLPGDNTLICLKDVDEVIEELDTLPLEEPLEGSRRYDWAFTTKDSEARIQACRCFRDKALSFTIRSDGDNHRPKGVIASHFRSRYDSRRRPDRSEFLNTFREIFTAIRDYLQLGLERPRVSGLLVIAGSTNCAKSNITRGIIHLYLTERWKRWAKGETKRKPHLVTVEDPIEKLLFTTDAIAKSYFEVDFGGLRAEHAKPWICSKNRPDYTPRELYKDVSSIKSAVRDALRQTPEVFYISETRNERDWEHILHLAESHFVVTTAHAVSLVAAFGLLTRATNVRSPQARGALAQKLLGIVHLLSDNKIVGQRGELSSPSFNIPSAWKRTPQSIKAFASEGLQTVVPMRFDWSRDCLDDPSLYCAGRSSFAAKLLADATQEKTVPAETVKWVRRRALQWDLRGE
jgi:hypothetical protein